MSIAMIRYQASEGPRWGRLSGAPPSGPADIVEVVPIPNGPATTADLIAALAAIGAPAAADPVSLRAEQLLSPVTSDGRLICQGLNYGEHASESRMHVRTQNLIFSKASSSLSGPFADVVKPEIVQLLDYEVEIGLVLRRNISGPTVITEQNIGDYVAGVVLCNDISARDVMFGATLLQWFEGKSYRTFCPTGPVLYLLQPDEVAQTLNNLELKLWLNGEQRQSGHSTQMIFKPAPTLTHLSNLMDLNRGDTLLTGTPGGVIAQPSAEIAQILTSQLLNDQTRQPALTAAFLRMARFLEPGDVITASLRDARLGRDLGGQRTVVAARQAANG